MKLTWSFGWKWWRSMLRAHLSRRCSWGAWECRVRALRTQALQTSSSRMPIASISSVKSRSERLLESELNAAMESSLDSAKESKDGSYESGISVSKLSSVVVGGILLISSSSRSSTRLWYLVWTRSVLTWLRVWRSCWWQDWRSDGERQCSARH
jgi:hypothetical protein